jgi:hypothetical protein
MTRWICAGHSSEQCNFINRRWWEWHAITQALDERCLLRTGVSGLGFAVGREPLAAHFAARGCKVLATDLAADMTDPGWIGSGQHAASKAALFQPLLVNPHVFERRVSSQAADMRTLSELEPGYDFLWSSCALEHLGSLAVGLRFIMDSMALLKPGGVAVHTTDFNVRSNGDTIEVGPRVIYRRRDILQLQAASALKGAALIEPCFMSVITCSTTISIRRLT